MRTMVTTKMLVAMMGQGRYIRRCEYRSHGCTKNIRYSAGIGVLLWVVFTTEILMLATLVLSNEQQQGNQRPVYKDNLNTQGRACTQSYFRTMQPGEKCRIQWSEAQHLLHITQTSVGKAWAKYKLIKDFSLSESYTQQVMNENPIPFILGRKPYYHNYHSRYNSSNDCYDHNSLVSLPSSSSSSPATTGDGENVTATITTTTTTTTSNDNANYQDEVIPFMIDHHHTLYALHSSPFGNATFITLEMVCNWLDGKDGVDRSNNNMRSKQSYQTNNSNNTSSSSTMSAITSKKSMKSLVMQFYKNLMHHNFMYSLSGRRGGGIIRERKDNDNFLPLLMNTSTIHAFMIHCSTVPSLVDDSWRSLASFVRKVKMLPLSMTTDETQTKNQRNKKLIEKGMDTELKCSKKKNSKYCYRGYDRVCDDSTGRLTPFYEFRWAYFLQDAYLRGCNITTGQQEEGNRNLKNEQEGGRSSYTTTVGRRDTLWDNPLDCERFSWLYEKLEYQTIDFNNNPVVDDIGDWKEAARLLIPLCRGKKALTYTLPESLGEMFGGKTLPGIVPGVDTVLHHDDEDCAVPVCPLLDSHDYFLSEAVNEIEESDDAL